VIPAEVSAAEMGAATEMAAASVPAAAVATRAGRYARLGAPKDCGRCNDHHPTE
jgi:hypothetical protein